MALPNRRRRRPLPSADAIAGNEDLMTEILIRLPAKSLCRFKSVSKRWRSLISHPDFSLLRMPKSVSGIFFILNPWVYKYVHLAGKRTRSAPFKSLTFVDDPLRIKILHSCNGLLLCSSAGYRESEIPKNKYYIYNPTTRQFDNIPQPCVVANPTGPAMNLAFDPSRTPHYKIVFVCPRSELSFQIKIFSSETGTWRTSGVPFTATLCQGFKNGVFLNGKIHWVSSQSETSLRFDVDQGCLETMPMPPIQDGSNKRIIGYFGESRGHLHLICGYLSPQFDVLEMETDYSKWFVKYRVDLEVITTTFPERGPFSYYRAFSALHLVRGEMEKESFLVLHIPGMLISYYFKDKTLKKHCLVNMHCKGEDGWLHAHPYVETLFFQKRSRRFNLLLL